MNRQGQIAVTKDDHHVWTVLIDEPLDSRERRSLLTLTRTEGAVNVVRFAFHDEDTYVDPPQD